MVETGLKMKSKSDPAEEKQEIQTIQPKSAETKVTMKAANVMVKKVLTVDEEASVKEAANIMNQFEIGSLIATRNGKPTGIITERDLLKRIVSEDRDAEKTKVKEIMSSPLIVISPDQDLEEAAELMFEKKIKKLPVTEENRLVGLLSLTDIARVQPMIKVLQRLSASLPPPKNIQKVLNSYIV